MWTAITGFKEADIWPCDRNTFTYIDFAPVETTNCPPPEVTANATEPIKNKENEQPANLPGSFPLEILEK